MEIEVIWQKIIEKIQKKMDTEKFELWIKPLKPLEIDENKFTLQVPNKFFSEWIKSNIKNDIEELLIDLTGGQKEIEFKLLYNIENILKENQFDEKIIEEKTPITTETIFNPKYTFESFIEGNSNRFAKAACLASANNPGMEYNPIFIYGTVGLGKTHLLHAIGNQILKEKPNLRILYITSERFITEFIDSLKYNTPASFRNKFRTLDCLLIDDIQFLIDKERSQEEFFYTFNALYDSRKQIIITSDRPPKELSNIEERLISRFEWGIIADIKPPDLETRIAILRKRAEQERIYVPDDIIIYLATKIKSNIRKLEGCLTRIVAFSYYTGTPLTIDIVKEILEDVMERQETTESISIEKIQEVVSDHYHLNTKDLKSKKRTDAIALPRQIAMYLARELTQLSTIEIGQAFGGKDHTTVIHACMKIKNKMNSDPFFVAEINKIRKKIRENQTV